jgi:hypothetical protein
LILTVTYSKEGWRFQLTSEEGDEGDLDDFTEPTLVRAKASAADILADLAKELEAQEHDPIRDFLEED